MRCENCGGDVDIRVTDSGNIARGKCDEREQLKEAIRQDKIAAFDYALHLTRLNSKELMEAGYRNHPAHMAAGMAIERTAAQIEAKIRKYEKEHP